MGEGGLCAIFRAQHAWESDATDRRLLSIVPHRAHVFPVVPRATTRSSPPPPALFLSAEKRSKSRGKFGYMQIESRLYTRSRASAVSSSSAHLNTFPFALTFSFVILIFDGRFSVIYTKRPKTESDIRRPVRRPQLSHPRSRTFPAKNFTRSRATAPSAARGFRLFSFFNLNISTIKPRVKLIPSCGLIESHPAILFIPTADFCFAGSLIVRRAEATRYQSLVTKITR